MRLPDQSKPILRVPLPTKSSVGLGDAIKRMTSAVGIKACGGCNRRAAFLNRVVAFGPSRGGGNP